MNERSEAVFRAALSATRRGALEIRLRNLPDDQKIEAARAFRKEPLLLSPDLEALGREILENARGPHISETTPLPLTLWRGGRTDVEGGEAIAPTLANFAEILQTRASAVCDKGRGWVVEPTSTIDGRRTNASTTAIHALFLDCDGEGNWDRLLGALGDLDYAFLAYQSGGWSEKAPKWRLALPLAAPYQTSSEAERALWKSLYAACRVLLGALGHLLGTGFDPATDTPAAPWFLTERRSASDPPRKVILRAPGRSLDLLRLALALPEISEPERPIQPSLSNGGVPKPALSSLRQDQLDRIVHALANVTTSVPSGRRTLYLALSGALLDREISPEDVLQIIEDVSARYPRPNGENHRDNLHSAKTTVGKWERGEDYTRIGTLQEAFPEVARALDQVLPDPLDEALRRSTEAMVRGGEEEDKTSLPAGGERRPPKRIASLLLRLRRIAEAKKEHKNPQQQLAGKLLGHLLDPAFHPETLPDPSRDALYRKAFALVGFEESEIDSDALIEALREGVGREPSAKDYAAGTTAFLEGRTRRAKWDAEAPAREARARAEAEASRERLRIFYATGKIP